jgi:hypothetical protein
MVNYLYWKQISPVYARGREDNWLTTCRIRSWILYLLLTPTWRKSFALSIINTVPLLWPLPSVLNLINFVHWLPLLASSYAATMAWLLPSFVHQVLELNVLASIAMLLCMPANRFVPFISWENIWNGGEYTMPKTDKTQKRNVYNHKCRLISAV